MKRNPSEQFRDSRREPIQFRGKEVAGIVRREIRPGAVLTVRWLSTSGVAPQGIQLKLDQGKLVANKQELRDVILGSDTSPEIVEPRCKISRETSTLKIWNAWRDEEGVTQAWIGNCGMIIEARGDKIRLNCSDGIGPPNFSDLIVGIQISDGSHDHE